LKLPTTATLLAAGAESSNLIPFSTCRGPGECDAQPKTREIITNKGSNLFIGKCEGFTLFVANEETHKPDYTIILL
jgi:hypothetical protein